MTWVDVICVVLSTNKQRATNVHTMSLVLVLQWLADGCTCVVAKVIEFPSHILVVNTHSPFRTIKQHIDSLFTTTLEVLLPQGLDPVKHKFGHGCVQYGLN